MGIQKTKYNTQVISINPSFCQSKVNATSTLTVGHKLILLSDVFSISGRGTVATGRAERGVCHKGDEVEVIGFGSKFKTTLTGIGMYCCVDIRC